MSREPIAGVTTSPFGRDEYATRLARTRAGMEAAGLGALVVTDPANMYWLTGYDAWSFYSHQAVVVLPGVDPFWWGRQLDVAGARLTTWMPDDHSLGFPEGLVQSDRHPHSHLAGVLTALGVGGAQIGTEHDAIQYTAAAHSALVAGLPGARIADATGLVNRCRAVKSPAELDYMQSAARIVEAAHRRVAEIIEPGIPRHLVAAAIAAAAIDGPDGLAGDYPAIVPLMPAASEAVAPHLTWDARPLESGSTMFLEIAGCVRRYHAPLSRSYHLGRPSPAVAAAEVAVQEALRAGLEAARPGEPSEAVAAAVFGALTARGFDRDGRCGYPVGAGYPPDWGERTLSLRAGDTTVLEPGMTLHLMPVLWVEDLAMGLTETIVISEDGPADSITDFPRRLVTIGG